MKTDIYSWGKRTKEESKASLTTGRRTFGQYSEVLMEKSIAPELKGRIMDSVILLAMTYGAGAWALPSRPKNT